MIALLSRNMKQMTVPAVSLLLPLGLSSLLDNNYNDFGTLTTPLAPGVAQFQFVQFEEVQALTLGSRDAPKTEIGKHMYRTLKPKQKADPNKAPFDCCVCLRKRGPSKKITFKCGHHLCTRCLKSLRKPTCPLCRAEILNPSELAAFFNRNAARLDFSPEQWSQVLQNWRQQGMSEDEIEEYLRAIDYYNRQQRQLQQQAQQQQEGGEQPNQPNQPNREQNIQMEEGQQINHQGQGQERQVAPLTDRDTEGWKFLMCLMFFLFVGSQTGIISSAF